MGAGQFNNASRTNNAQSVDVLEGKVLRLNTETDGDSGKDAWIPNDNPYYDNASITGRDYVYTMGHRNVQGLAWATINGNERLFGAEHGDKSDDEVNILTAGGNYGWNRVSGYCDGNYNGMTLGGYSPVNEQAFCTATATIQQPIKTFFTASASAINALSTDYLTWPTVAPSSIEVYEGTQIPYWQHSLLITCLKAGRVYRLKLNAAGNAVTTIAGGVDTASYFRGEGRFRDLAISPDGLKIYLACDASGQTSGPTGSFNGGGTPPPNAGSILEFSYAGAVLQVTDQHLLHPATPTLVLKMSPNPVREVLTITLPSGQTHSLTASIFSVSGICVMKAGMTKNECKISVAMLPAGIYFITDDGQVRKNHGH
jgi:glucose/arabinose dehydrogenase